jgi:hypothetical protein
MHSKRRKNNKRFWRNISTAIEKLREYNCRCGRGGKIYLGLNWAKWINITFAAAIIFINAWTIIDQEDIDAIIIADLVVAIVFAWGYVDLYRAMRKAQHSVQCSRGAAMLGNLYSSRGSYYSVYPPKE